MKILTVIGARPQFIKAGVVSKALAETDQIDEVVIHTGQHFDSNMSDIFFNQLNIKPPKYRLDIHSGSHGDMTGRMLIEIEKILLDEKPDYVMVYGDTNSTLAGALAASKLHVPVIHVEAGLRSFNMKMPEEVNRILTDQVSNMLFCPTASAINNLKNEGFENKKGVRIYKNGDVMQDSAMLLKLAAQKPQGIMPEGAFALCTVHRAENTDDIKALTNIVEALNDIHDTLMPVILPVHPRTKQAIEKAGLKLNVYCIDPVGYLEMLWLLDNCKFVLTDSGGLQKEAFFFSKPCVTMREQTEWIELVDCGANVLTGANKKKIILAVKEMKDVKITDPDNLYGGGKASQTIANTLLKVL